MTEAERQRREQLEAALEKGGLALGGASRRWLQWEWVPRYRNWDSLVPDLYVECEAGGGPITDCYVDGLLNIAEHVIPPINSVEGT